MTTFRQLTRVLQRLFGRRRRADRRLARNVSRPAVEWLEDRSLLAAVTVDPQLFEGSYHVTGHPTLHTGDYTYDLSPGTYLLGISGPGSFTFSVDGSGNVSTSSAAASAVGSTLRLNNSTVQIDPQAFAGQYSIGYGVAPIGTGIRDIVVVPGLSGVYGLAIAGPGSFSFSVDASGDVSGSTSAADFFANNITLRNSTVHIDPQAFAGQYSVGYGVAPVGTGIRDIVVVPGLSGVYGLAIAGLGSFSFSVDSTGNVSGSTPAANFSGMSITFYNSTVHVDPQDYTGRYTVDYVGASLGAGEQDFVVVPAVVAYYRLNLNGTGDILFAVDAGGNVSTASASVVLQAVGIL